MSSFNARTLTPESLEQACDEALCEVIEEEEDNDTQPVAPYAWMRNGGQIDEDYDDSDDAKEQDVEAFKAERRQGQGSCRGLGSVKCDAAKALKTSISRLHSILFAAMYLLSR
ncbi:hypothetical protein J4714_14140 [Staphylococcus epidermidis]|nr:hypothetical protein [Staphylococcus epidermidis]